MLQVSCEPSETTPAMPVMSCEDDADAGAGAVVKDEAAAAAAAAVPTGTTTSTPTPASTDADVQLHHHFHHLHHVITELPRYSTSYLISVMLIILILPVSKGFFHLCFSFIRFEFYHQIHNLSLDLTGKDSRGRFIDSFIDSIWVLWRAR